MLWHAVLDPATGALAGKIENMCQFSNRGLVWQDWQFISVPVSQWPG